MPKKNKGFAIIIIPIIMAVVMAVMLFFAAVAKANELCDGSIGKLVQKAEKAPGAVLGATAKGAEWVGLESASKALEIISVGLVTTICQAIDKVDSSFKKAMGGKGVVQNIAPTEPSISQEECLKNSGTSACYKASGNWRSVSPEEVKKFDLAPIPQEYTYSGSNNLYINRGIIPIIKEAYKNCDGCFKIVSAFRSVSHQLDLWNNNGCPEYIPGQTYSTCYEGPYPVGVPGTSNHQTGEAIDVTGSGGTTCTNSGKKCSLEIVEALTSLENRNLPAGKNSLKHFHACRVRDNKYETGSDCVHFSLTGS